MARLPRVVAPGHPHHVTQRGNRRGRVFFEEGDYALYVDLLSEAALGAGTEIWCYCLMGRVEFLLADARSGLPVVDLQGDELETEFA